MALCIPPTKLILGKHLEEKQKIHVSQLLHSWNFLFIMEGNKLSWGAGRGRMGRLRELNTFKREGTVFNSCGVPTQKGEALVSG